jgi:hypothetical protein
VSKEKYRTGNSENAALKGKYLYVSESRRQEDGQTLSVRIFIICTLRKLLGWSIRARIDREEYGTHGKGGNQLRFSSQYCSEDAARKTSAWMEGLYSDGH